MRQRRGNAVAVEEKSMSSQWLGLSLFIMLLAFFIVLNAISSYEEEKVSPVLDSLGYAFSARLEQRIKAEESPSVTQDEAQSVNEGSSLDRLQALFKTQLPSHEVIVSHGKGMMYVKVPFDDFEKAVMAVGQRSVSGSKESTSLLDSFFLPTLISLMNMDENNAPYRMDVVLNINESPARLQNRRPKRLAAIMKKMGRLSGKIEDAGLPTKLISTGLKKGKKDMVELIFRRHVAFNPLGSGGDSE